jgi:DNA-binding protein YbaB
LLPAAINDALVKGRELNAQALQEITGGVPGLGDMMSKFGGPGAE